MKKQQPVKWLSSYDEKDFAEAGEESKKIYLAKSDLKSTFRILPILPQQRRFLIMKAKNPKNGKTMFFIEKCLPFGASISCVRFQLFSDSLRHITEFMIGRQFVITNYLDDYLFIHTEETGCNGMVRTFLEVCENIGCPVALEKTEWASLQVVFLEILLDGVSLRLWHTDRQTRQGLRYAQMGSG